MADPHASGAGEVSLPEDRVLEVLSCGEIEILGLLPYASNATLLTRVRDDGVTALAVYKPRRGETPLWDFPDGTLCLREYAAWIVDRALGWHLVPPTVLRDGPAGFGAVQLFVEEDTEADLRRLPHTHPVELQRMALFDVVANNADRKGGHCIVDVRGKLWGVDHGICFHAEPKLRTIIWAFEGEPIPDDLIADLEGFGNDPEARVSLDGVLAPEEIEALDRRIARLVGRRRFPTPGSGRHVPWPPW
jgi:hypothetical protein